MRSYRMILLAGTMLLLVQGTVCAETVAPAITGYSISGTANNSYTNTTDSPFYVDGYRETLMWPPIYMVYTNDPAYAETSGSVVNGTDYCQLHIATGGHGGYAEWEGEYGMSANMALAESTCEIESLISVGATGTVPANSPMELFLSASLTGNPDDWRVEVYRDETLLATLHSGLLDVTINAVVGESLRMETSFADGEDESWSMPGGEYSSTLDVTVHATATAVPEPTATLLMIFGAIALLAIRHK